MTAPRTIGATIGCIVILGLLFVEFADGILRSDGGPGIWGMM